MAKKGGWVTFPFIIAANMGVTFAYGGMVFNLMVYLIQDFNIKKINAAQIFTVVNGCIQTFPLLGAIIADSFLGCYSVIWISSIILSLGTLFLVIIASFSKLKPMKCVKGSDPNLCGTPSSFQLGILYTSLALVAFGVGVKRYNIGPMGASQLNTRKQQTRFFNWYVFTMYLFIGISTISIGYVGGKFGWAWGFAISGAVNILGLAVYLSGTRFYRRSKPQGGSPFVALVRVVVVAIRKRKLSLSEKMEDYCQEPGIDQDIITIPSTFFRFFNRAALKLEGETTPEGLIRNPWRLCTVKEVEDLKSLIKLLPLWSSAILVNVPLIIQYSSTLLQALTMDHHLGSHFQIPPSSINIFVFIGTCSTIFLLDRFILPMWEKLNRRPMTLLQRVAIGHVVDIVCMIVSALVEIKRLNVVKLHNLENKNDSVVPMSVFWLVPGLVLSGIGEGFHIPGNFAFNYQEFPAGLKSTSNGIVGLAIGLAFYIGTALIEYVKKGTNWMPDNINKGRLDNVFWLVGIIGGINFGYFLVCSYLYEYRKVEEEEISGDEDFK
ncbi:OLC1v1004095C1 [Oldenlandia corymbosa var. corymbosa]|uniref:OLC1v1004095C1 n=1 Tax=Oldenlandia corymbosa var. corymbosa TaxID=529605 RepID=A0AAV1DEW7_OLDCO|nr:OLC1v1004095C1 [Oldenlandia corymbosa var. corymbosa]